jgi:ABC-type transporter Mla MlaB component
MAVPQAGTITFEVRGPIARDDLPGLVERVCRLLAQTRAHLAVCDIVGVDADVVALDALARLALTARRRGCAVKLRGASPALLELVALAGLEDVLGHEPR